MEGFKDLLLRAKRGDEDAVEKLFVRYQHSAGREDGQTRKRTTAIWHENIRTAR